MLLTGCMTAGMLLPSMGVSEVKAAANVADGLAGYWTFDGSTQEEQLANLADGSDVAAVKTGSGVTLKADGGISEGSVYFSKQDASYLKLNLQEANRGLNAASEEFSIAAWIKFDASPFTAGTDKILSLIHI